MLDCSCATISIIMLNSLCVYSLIQEVLNQTMNGSRPPTAAEWISEWKSLPPTDSWHTAKHTLTSENELPATQNQSQRPTPSQTHVTSHQNTRSQTPTPLLSYSPCLTHLIPLPSSAALRWWLILRQTLYRWSQINMTRSHPVLTHNNNRCLCACERDRKRCIWFMV